MFACITSGVIPRTLFITYGSGAYFDHVLCLIAGRTGSFESLGNRRRRRLDDRILSLRQTFASLDTIPDPFRTNNLHLDASLRRQDLVSLGAAELLRREDVRSSGCRISAVD